MLEDDPLHQTNNINSQVAGSNITSDASSICKCLLLFKRKQSLSIILSCLNLILTLSCIILYIYTLYYPNVAMREIGLFYFNFASRVFFVIDYILDFIANNVLENRFKFLTQLVIEIASTIPFFVSLAVIGFQNDLSDNAFVISSALIGFRIFRILSFAQYIQSDVNRELYNIMCSIFCLLITSSILINVIENTQSIGNYWLFLPRDCFDKLNCNGSNDSFHSSFFFVMTTVATIGYYSTINSVVGRCIIIGLILLSVIEIPTQSSNLMIQLSSKSVYARTAYKKLDNVEFILISGNISYGSILVLLQEYFHPDHGENERHALILLPSRPDNNIKSLLQEYQNKLFYFEGDPLKINDLQRCQFKNANMIMLLCNKQTDDSSAEDSKTIIQAMAIKKFFAQEEDSSLVRSSNKIIPKSTRTLNKLDEIEDENGTGRNDKKAETNKEENKEEEALKQKDNKLTESRLIIQLLRPESEHHFSLSISKNNTTDQILCIDELKLSLLAKSCLCRGIIALISNLIITNNSSEFGEKQLFESMKWIEEYKDGQDYEIYKIQLEHLRGYKFSSCAEKIYDEKKTILFGLNLESKSTFMNLVLLSPMDFILPLEKDVIVSGYLLAKDQNDADNVVAWTKTQKKMNSKIEEIVDPVSKMNKKKMFNRGIELNDEEQYNISDYENHSKDLYSTDALSFAKICHITTEHISKASVTIDSIDKMLIAKGHIIICGICQNLIDFIKPLRAKYLPKTEFPTIVILSKELPEDKIWNTISFFEQLYLVQGDPMKRADLKRAGIKFALRVVILAPSVNEISQFILNKRMKNNKMATEENVMPMTAAARKLTKEEEDLLDAKTIFKYNMISRMKNDIFCVIELINPSNVSFLNNKMRKNNDEYRFIKAGLKIDATASFASGEVYYSSIMDNVISQAYYNPSLLSVLKKLIVGEDQSTLNRSNLIRYKNVLGGNLYLIDMPLCDFPAGSTSGNDEKKIKFEEIFKIMLKRKIVVIGVYRCGDMSVFEKTSSEKKINNRSKLFIGKLTTTIKESCKEPISDSSFYYVVTAPKETFEITQKDKLFVLSPVFPDDEMMNINQKIEKEKDNNYEQNDPVNSGKGHSKKVEEKKEGRKEIDQEGEAKLLTFNAELQATQELLGELEKSIDKAQNDSDLIIAESLQKKIHKIYKSNKY